MCGVARAPNSGDMNVPPSRQAALGGLCPRCGVKTLFDSRATFAPKCRACGSIMAASMSAMVPPPSALIVGALITAAPSLVELGLHRLSGVHVLLWVPITALAVIGSLRGEGLLRSNIGTARGTAGPRTTAPVPSSA